jgi:hypothetical protein
MKPKWVIVKLEEARYAVYIWDTWWKAYVKCPQCSEWREPEWAESEAEIRHGVL